MNAVIMNDDNESKKYYDEETDFAIKLVVDPHDSEKDVLVNWIGEIDTSLLDQSYIEFGVEK